MQIAAADIDQLNPPTDAADLMRYASSKGHALWAGWETLRSGRRLFSLRVDGPGWDIAATWSAPRESAPYLASLLVWEDAVGKWEYASLTEARDRIGAS